MTIVWAMDIGYSSSLAMAISQDESYLLVGHGNSSTPIFYLSKLNPVDGSVISTHTYGNSIWFTYFYIKISHPKALTFT